jgi:hypothetical protein
MPVLSRIEVRAIDKGKLLNAREWVIKVLETRFEDVPEEIKKAINQLEDVTRLKQLLKQAITISSVADFQGLLD